MRTTALSLLILFALFSLFSESWLAEDAAITLRAVENLYETQGPVYNPGERTEVYTHPLWFAALVTFRGMGLNLPVASVFAGIAISILGLFLLCIPPAGTARGEPPFKYIYLLIPLFLAAHPGFRQFAASGMEIGLLTLLLGLFYLFLENYRPTEKPGTLGFLLGLIYLTRPELGLFAAWYGLFFLWELYQQKHLMKRQITGRALRSVLGLVLTAGLWHLFRYLYYHDLFPNTFYAKAGLGSYWIQGAKYLAHALIYGPSAWLILVLAGAYVFLSLTNRPITEEPRARSHELFRLLRDVGAVLVMVVYVVRLGGDFMAFRFLVPELIMIAWIARRVFTIPLPTRWNGWLSHQDSRPLHVFAAGLLLCIIFLFIPVPPAKGFIANERFHFVSKFEKQGPGLFDPANHPWGARGKRLGLLQQCLQYRTFRIANSQAEAHCMQGMGLGYVGYEAGPYVQIVDEQGISDSYVARTPIILRFRPGHEHSIGTLEVMAKDVLFCNTGDRKYDEIMKTKYGTIVRLDPDLLATIPNIENRLQSLLELKKSGSPAIEMLEKRYETSVEELLDMSSNWKDDLTLEKRKCWE